ncbi:DNA-formamidopyrimidine glycosylase family protein, partial [Nocardioides sp.]|uniref:DNA-formamidopyrimidine glycosylase family protein n=1 Tax=Nocardioides sp. TaxID=35761 RepID=UPI00271F7CA8
MPEGHSIHRLARRHRQLLVGRAVRTSSPQGRFEVGAATIDGQVLASTEAWGKHLFHRYDDHWLHVHLGLFGRFRDGRGEPPEARGALRLRLVADDAWADLRGPTACELLDDGGRDVLLARLGPDP